jgi:hypothetical protein
MLDVPADLLAILNQYELLDDFIRRKLIEQIVNTQNSLVSNSSLLNAESDITKQKNQKSNSSELLEAKIIAQQTRQDRLNQYKFKNYSSLAKAHYLKNRNLYDMFLYGLISTQDRSMAFELYFRVVDDRQSFWDLATTYSQDTSRFTGGVIGPIRACNVAPIIADQLLALKPRTVCQPFLFNDHWHILYLARYIRSALSRELHVQIIDSLFNQHLDEQIERCKGELVPHLKGQTP